MNRITRTLMLFVACFLAAQMSAQTSDRSKAKGYQFSEEELTRYPQKTNVPTVYLEVYKTTYPTNDKGKVVPTTTFDAEGNPVLEDLSVVFGQKTETYYNAQIIIRDDYGTIEERKEPTTVRGRGNATWDIFDSSKKPLRLKFPKKVSLLGADFANSKSWTLLANHLDLTLIRNAMANEVGHIVGLPFCPAYKFIDLYVNGQYKGTYQISDQVQVAADRVNINETTGYFLEFNSNKRAGFLEDPYMVLGFNGQTLYANIKSPDAAEGYTVNASDDEIKSNPTQYETQDPQYSALRTHLQNVASLVFTGAFSQTENWRKYVNLESAVKAFIGMDITGNYDGSVANNYAYMNSLESEIFFGPLWDFDIAWGGYGDMANKHFYEGEYNTFGILCKKVFDEDPYFVKALYEYWAPIYNNGQLISDLQNKVTELQGIIRRSASYNFSNVEEGGAGEPMSNWANSYSSHDAAVEAMISFIDTHLKWLDAQYAAKYEALGCKDLTSGEGGAVYMGPEFEKPYEVTTVNYNNGWNDYLIPATAFNSKASSALIKITGAHYVKLIDKSDVNNPVVLQEFVYNNDGVMATYTVSGQTLQAALSDHLYFNCDGCEGIKVTVTNYGCTTHSFTDYDKQSDGTYRRICSVCSTAEPEGTVYYKFTVYPESAISTEEYLTTWSPETEKPNSIAIVNVEPAAVPTGTNIVNIYDGTCADFKLSDGHTYYSPVKFKAANAVYSRQMTNTWGTLCLPFKYQQAETETASFYHLASVENVNGAQTLMLIPINPDSGAGAFKPVFVKCKNAPSTIFVTGTDITVKATDDAMSNSTVEGWTLKGAMEASVIDVTSTEWADKNVYYISNNKFWHATGKVNISPFRAYLEGPALTSSQAIGLMVDDGEATGIMSIENGELIIDSEADAWYSLDGRLLPVRPTSKGIYIHNGRKEVIR